MTPGDGDGWAMATADGPAALASVHDAVTDAEREAIWAFRYRVYVEEMGRKAVQADHERGWVRDPEDDKPYSTHLYTHDGGVVTGAIRFRCWGPGMSRRRSARRSRSSASRGSIALQSPRPDG